MRSLTVSLLATLAVACSPATTADPAAPEEPDAGAPCPAATDPCMNADNHAACLQVAASCDGEVLQMESCPLQFACSTSDSGESGPVDDAPSDDGSSTSTGSYDPCAGKNCGEPCQVCPPDDADCVETAVVKECSATGECSGTAAVCE